MTMLDFTIDSDLAYPIGIGAPDKWFNGLFRGPDYGAATPAALALLRTVASFEAWEKREDERQAARASIAE